MSGLVLLASCDNLIEPDGVPCPGRLRYRWGMIQAACDTCGGWCGIAVAPWLSVVADTTAGEAEDIAAKAWRDGFKTAQALLMARVTFRADTAAAPAARSGGAQDDGVALIAAERRRQVEDEGWTPEHDAEHASEGLALAACCYAVPPQMRKYRNTGAGPIPVLWPWAPGYWKPKPDDRVRELVKAGALIAAEIDRLRRALAGPDDARQDGAR